MVVSAIYKKETFYTKDITNKNGLNFPIFSMIGEIVLISISSFLHTKGSIGNYGLNDYLRTATE